MKNNTYAYINEELKLIKKANSAFINNLEGKLILLTSSPENEFKTRHFCRDMQEYYNNFFYIQYTDEIEFRKIKNNKIIIISIGLEEKLPIKDVEWIQIKYVNELNVNEQNDKDIYLVRNKYKLEFLNKHILNASVDLFFITMKREILTKYDKLKL